MCKLSACMVLNPQHLGAPSAYVYYMWLVTMLKHLIKVSKGTYVGEPNLPFCYYKTSEKSKTKYQKRWSENFCEEKETTGAQTHDHLKHSLHCNHHITVSHIHTYCDYGSCT